MRGIELGASKTRRQRELAFAEDKARAEERLADLLKQLRNAANDVVLNDLLRDSLAHLASMEGGLRSYAQTSIDLANQEPVNMQKAHHAYQLTVSRHLYLFHAERENEVQEAKRIILLRSPSP